MRKRGFTWIPSFTIALCIPVNSNFPYIIEPKLGEAVKQNMKLTRRVGLILPSSRNNGNSQGHGQAEINGPSELFDEVVNVFTDFLRLFLVEKVGYSIHYNNFLQKWYISLEATVVYIFLDSCRLISNIQVTHNKLHRNFDLYPGPRCSKLPGSAIQWIQIYFSLHVQPFAINYKV